MTATAAAPAATPTIQAIRGYLGEMKGEWFKAITQKIVYRRQLIGTVQTGHRCQPPHDVVGRDGWLVLYAFAVDADAMESVFLHVAHDLDRKSRRGFRTLCPRRMPHADRLEIVRHPANHDAFVEVDARHFDLGIVDVKIKFQEIQFEASREDADVALQLFLSIV